MLLRRVLARPARIVEGAPLVDADPDLVRLEIVGAQETHVVGGDQRHAVARRQRTQRGDVVLFVLAADALHLEIEAVLEHRQMARHHRLGQCLVLGDEGVSEFALHAAGQGDQAVARLLQPLEAQLGPPALLALTVGAGEQHGELPVAFAVSAQQAQAMRAPGRLALDPDVGPDQRLDAGGQRRAVELHQGEQIAFVGEGDRRHAGIAHGGDQLRDADDAVGQRILAVHAQMNERSAHAFSRIESSTAATGAKLRRCTGLAPRRRKAARCSAVG
ncbi:MAG: hypothetical protein KatS3mg121_1378 [Gammaproteobacteria bacterium]|nr:MAG: hypothetical protein KatS3mg121_1378 [Gammaproteobacteria bacterium]